MPEVPEYVVNVKLAEILSKDLSIDARAERIKGRRRPDIRCYYKGLIISVEASYSKNDAEKDAEKRIEQGLADIAIALWLKNKYRDVSEIELEKAIRNSIFDVKVIVPREVAGTLIPFLERGVRKKVEHVTGWFRDVDIPMFGTIIRNAIEFLAREEEVKKLVDEVKGKISDFVKALSSIDTNKKIYRQIYGILYRLYGLSIAEAEDPEVVFGQAALSILLSATFYEHIRNKHPQLKPLREYVQNYGALEGLRRALEDLLRIDYRVAVEATLEILRQLPPNVTYRIRDLIELSTKITRNPSLLRRDFAGRVYHEITGDIALRKGFATFYTEVPAAYMLASLAVETLLDLDVKDVHRTSANEAREIIDRIRFVKVGDLACGSGTLLTASYSILLRLATMLKYYYDLEDADLNEIAKAIIGEGIYGIDALRYASQITALNLALISPGNISRENVYTIYLGYIPQKRQAWLGSLELLNNAEKVGGILAWIEGGLKGIAEKVSLEGSEGAFTIPRKFDLIIMNPPFTRATGRTKRFGEGRGLFGFVADESAREKLLEAYKGIRDRIRNELKSIMMASTNIFPEAIKDVVRGQGEFKQYLSIGQAGEGLLFLHLAYKYVKDSKVIAFVLPRGLLAGITWFLARVLLASKFHVKYVVVSSDAKKGYNFSEGTSLSETLIVAKKISNTGSVDSNAETVFINLLRKPSTVLEALMLAEEVKRVSWDLKANEARIVEVGSSSALIVKIPKRQLLKNIDNWNRFVAYLDSELIKILLQAREGRFIEVETPMVKLYELIDVVGLAVRRGTFHDVFKRVERKVPGAVPALIGGGEELRKSILVIPNAWVVPTDPRYLFTASKFLVPDRVWVDTMHAIALYSEEPVVASTFFGLKPKKPQVSEDHLKALILWFNTTWGLLTILAERTETRGRWSEFTLVKWKLMPVPNVLNLPHGVVRSLAGILDKYAKKRLKRLPEQFNPKNPDPVRLGIDMDFLKTLNPSLDDTRVKEALLDLYRHVYEALITWIGEG